MIPTRQVSVALAATLVIACGASDGPGTSALCADSVSVAVDTGATPDISWSPACPESELVVDPNSDIIVSWVIRTIGDTNGLVSPIQYGTAPVGASTIFGPAPLQVGATYRVRVIRATGDSTSPFQIVGGTYFMP